MPAEDLKKERLMIQLETEVLEGIDELAKGMRRTKAWLVAELLVETIKRRDAFVEWMTFRVIGKLTHSKRKKGEGFLGGNVPRPRTKETEYQQVFISPEALVEIDELAARLNRTRAAMCTELVTCAFEDGQLLLKLVNSEVFTAVWDRFKLPRGRQHPGNREENRKRREDD